MSSKTSQDQNNVVCLFIDGWHIGYVGAYGNAWLRTPALDRLASESFVLDRAIVNSTCQADQYRAIWRGDWRAAFEPVAHVESTLAPLASSGRHTVLVTDDDAVYRGAEGVFAESIFVEIDPAMEAARKLESTRLAQFFERLSSVIADTPAGSAIWAHTRGLTLDWDAPYEFRARHADADDPPPPRTIEPPDFVVPHDVDPDVLLGLRQAYAGQIEVLDACVGALVEQFDTSLARDTTALFLLSSGGYPLGEHGVVGTTRAALYAESVCIPWLVRFPPSMAAVDRSDALVQPSDLMPTVLDWLGVAEERAASLLPLFKGGVTCLSDRLLVSGQTPEQHAFVTTSWYLKNEISAAGHVAQQLFAKPDDRWDKNDVAAVCPDTVAAINAHVEETRKLGGQNDWRPLEPSLRQRHT